MPNLTSAVITAQIQYALSKTVTGIGAVKTDTLTSGPKTTASVPTTIDSCVAETLTIAASGTSTIDLKSYLDPLGDAGAATKVFGILLIPTAADVVLSPGASNGLVWFFGGTTPTFTVKAGATFLYYDPAGFTVDSTHKTLLLTNASGSVACSVIVVIITKG